MQFVLHFSNGEEWYRFRHLFQKILMSPSIGEACSNDLETVTEDLVAKIPSQLDEHKEMDIQPLLFNWALECKLIFNYIVHIIAFSLKIQ